jgi:uncharacterized protein (TIGR02246 family)
MRIKLVAVGLAVSTLVAVSVVLQARQDTKAAIAAGNKQFVATFAKGDAAGLAAMYTSTAQAFPPNAELVQGRDALQKLWQGAMASGIKEVGLTTTEVEAHGDTAIEVGTYAMNAAGGKPIDRGKFIVIWKRENGQWKLHRDIWNSNMPAAPSK